MLERMPEETALQHHRRLISGKLIDGTLSDMDYSELAPYVYGKEYSADVARRMMYGSARTLQLVDAEREESIEDTAILSELELKKIELRKEQQKFFDQRNAFNKLVRDQARDDELKEILERAVASGSMPVLDYTPHTVEATGTSLLVSLNDIHYGAQYDNYWGKYDSDVCKRMFGLYLERIIEIAQTHKAEDCYVTCNGDAISGVIHASIRLTNKENVIEQVTGVSELIAQFLAKLSAYFGNVYFTSVAGNHSRLDKKDDAVLQERLDDLVEWYLKARMAAFENVHVGYGNKVDCTMYLLDIYGKNYLGVHGDFEASVGGVTNLQAMVGVPLYAVLMGHRHHNSTDVVQGIRVVQSGSFLGTDNYCISKRLFGIPEQIVCVVDNKGIRCHYDVELKL